MRIAAVQHDIVWEDSAATLARLEPVVRGAFDDGTRLVVLPEMFAVGFSMAPERVAEPIDGPTTTWLVEQATRAGGWICGSIPERGASGRPRNVLVVAGPQGEVHRYAKIHPFTYSGEHEHYDAGDEFLTVEIDGVRSSFFVCYDLRFADEFWALAPATDLYVVVANWPAARRQHWRALLVARAIENQAFVVGCNRVGTGDGIAYAGDSAIVDPLGEVLVCEEQVEALLVADVSGDAVAKVRDRFPFLADRRT